MSEIENVRIDSVSITMEDHGCLTFLIRVIGNGFGCGIGNYIGGHGYLGSRYWSGSGSMLVAMMKIMNVVGVERWESLRGQYCRVKINDGIVVSIGNIIRDNWFDIKQFFSMTGEETPFVLDERPKEQYNKEDVGDMNE